MSGIGLILIRIFKKFSIVECGLTTIELCKFFMGRIFTHITKERFIYARTHNVPFPCANTRFFHELTKDTNNISNIETSNY